VVYDKHLKQIKTFVKPKTKTYKEDIRPILESRQKFRHGVEHLPVHRRQRQINAR